MAWWSLGVDLGTTYCAAAVVREGGRLDVMDVAGERRTPATVVWRDGRLLAGRYADSLRAARPEAAERNPKRRAGGPPLLLDQHPVTAAAALAALLDLFVAEGRRLFDGVAPAQLALTHPVDWTTQQLDDLRAAAAQVLPGVPLSLVPEPVAAAVEVAADQAQPVGSRLAVFDLGGGTLDVAVLRVVPGSASAATGFEVMGTPQGASDLGGEEFDQLLTDHLVAELHASPWWQRTQAEAGPDSLRDLDELLRTARMLKESLSDVEAAEAFFAPAGTQVQVTRATFDELIADVVRRQLVVLDTALASARTPAVALTGIYLVGAASRTPAVQAALRAKYGDLVRTWGDPKLLVASGAARLALASAESAPSAESAGSASVPEPAATQALPPVPTESLPVTPAAPAYGPEYGYSAGYGQSYAPAPAPGYGNAGYPNPGYENAGYPSPGYESAGHQQGYDPGYQQPQPGYAYEQGAYPAAQNGSETIVRPIPPPPADGERRGNGAMIAIAIAVVLCLVGGGVVAWLLLRPPPSPSNVTESPSASRTDGTTTNDTATTPAGTQSTTSSVDPANSTNIAGSARGSADTTADSNVDGNKKPVSYGVENTTDGDTTTTWRTDGDASGQSITYTFDHPVVITELGLINGYTKIDSFDGTDRYLQERRILSVTWRFSDGTSIDQSLQDGTRSMQTKSVTPVTTTSVELVIDSTTAPGNRDYTAISEVEIQGQDAP